MEVEHAQPGVRQIRQPAETLWQCPQVAFRQVEHPICVHPGPEPDHRKHVRVVCTVTWEARPERVTQRTTGKREAERIIRMHQIGDKREAAMYDEHAERGSNIRIFHPV